MKIYWILITFAGTPAHNGSFPPADYTIFQLESQCRNALASGNEWEKDNNRTPSTARCVQATKPFTDTQVFGKDKVIEWAKKGKI